jgi:hypothetical protein
LPPYDEERVKFFTITPKTLHEIVLWLSTKKKIPSFPSTVQTWERDAQRSQLHEICKLVDCDVLGVFREYANYTNVGWGLEFRSFPVSVPGAKALLRANQEDFDSIKTYSDYLLYLDRYYK